MSQKTNAADCGEAVRRQTLATLRTLKEKGKEFGLPDPPAALEQYQQKLEENTYRVLVVGEAKRGKSTFVNALIGRDILPTDVDIATSQVFCICPADKEAYRIRFEDDSLQSITAADLPSYGSQVMADAVGVPRLDQIIRWIEVDAPVKFLPPNVRILDTPGLGALYSAHAEITNRFVPHADAVIFVLDSQAPIGEPEIKFVEKLLGATNHVLFIQTKIDQFRKEAWQEIQKRNEDILGQRFKDRLVGTRVWPISSTNLRKAAQSGDDDYLIVSRHKELAAALQAFLFLVAGWSRAAATIVAAEHVYVQSRKTLATRLDSVMQESKQKRTETQELAVERRMQFDSDWGERGQKRRVLVENIRNATALARQDFRQALQPGGAIETSHREKIDGLQSLEDAKRLAETMPAQLAETALNKWRQVCEHVQAHCLKLIGPFLSDAEKVSLATNASNEDVNLPVGTTSDLGADSFARFKAAWSDSAVVLGVGGIGSSVFAAVAATTWFPPLTAFAVLGAAMWIGVRGWQAAGLRQLKEAQAKLKDAQSKQIQQIRGHFFDVSLANGRSGRAEEYFTSLEETLTDHVAKLAMRKLAEAQAEINRLSDAANLDDQQRKANAANIRRQLTEWDAIGHAIQGIRNALQELAPSRTDASCMSENGGSP